MSKFIIEIGCGSEREHLRWEGSHVKAQQLVTELRGPAREGAWATIHKLQTKGQLKVKDTYTTVTPSPDGGDCYAWHCVSADPLSHSTQCPARRGTFSGMLCTHPAGHNPSIKHRSSSGEEW